VVFTASSLLDVKHLKELVWRKTGKSLVVALSKALNGIASTYE